MIVSEFERHEALGRLVSRCGPAWVVLLQNLEDALIDRARGDEVLIGAGQRLLCACKNQVFGCAGEIHAIQVFSHALQDMQAAHAKDFRVIIQLKVRKEVFGRVKLLEVGENLAHAALLSVSTW